MLLNNNKYLILQIDKTLARARGSKASSKLLTYHSLIHVVNLYISKSLRPQLNSVDDPNSQGFDIIQFLFFIINLI